MILEKIKQVLIEELKKQISELKEEQQNYARYTIYNDEQFLKLYDERNQLDKTNLLNKLLHFRSLKKRRKEIVTEMNDYTSLCYQENREKINNLELIIRNLQEKLRKVEDAKTIYDLDITSKETFIEFMKEKNIEYTIEDIINSNISFFFDNYEFMQQAIDLNYNNYKYDKTNNIELLKQFLLEKVKNTGDNISGILQKEDIEDLLNKLNDSNFLQDEINIKLIQYISDYIKKRLIATGDFYFTVKFDEFRKIYESPLGQEIEKLYDDDSIILGVHGTNYYEEPNENSIFKNGIKNSTQDDRAINCLNRTVAYDLSYIDILQYDGSGYAGSKILRYNYIVTIPKDPNAPIWGSNEENSINNYLLPEYVFGVIDSVNKTEIVLNAVKDKANYAIKYVDGSREPITTMQK